MIGATFAFAVVGLQTASGGWSLSCASPLDLLRFQLENPRQYQWPVPGSPLSFSHHKRSGIRVSLMPDLIGYGDETLRPGRTWSFSTANESKSFKAQLLRRVGLVEGHSQAFGATFSFATAPNWAFQFRGTQRFTVAYITRF